MVFAFGQEETEIKNYDKYLARAKAIGIKGHMKGALAVGGFFLAVYAYYPYSFYIGSYFITGQVENINNNDAVYSGGDIMSCFLGVIYGIFSLGMAAPNFKAIAEGKIAGKMAFDIIERVPVI